MPILDERTKARRRALDLLHQADVNGTDPLDALRSSGDVPALTRELVEGVAGNRDEIDGMIRGYAERWELERMPVVDRNLLRIGIFEILHRDDIPVGATINDCVELAKLLSTAESGRFVNALLGRAAREHGA